MALDTCFGTSATAKAWLQLPESCQFVEFESCFVCLRDVLSSLIEVFIKQVSSVNSDITRIKEVVGAKTVFAKEIAVSTLK